MMFFRNHITLLAIENSFIALLAGLTSRNLQITIFLTYHVSIVISSVRYRFQNIGSFYDNICKNCYLRLTMGLSFEKKKKSEILDYLFIFLNFWPSTTSILS